MDLISAVEAAYDLAPDDDAWLDTLCRVVSPYLNYGLGTVAFTYEVDAEHRARAITVKQHGTPFDVTEQVRSSHAALPPSWVETVLMVPGHVGSGIEVMPEDLRPRLHERLRAADAPPDSMGIAVGNLGGRGVVFCAALPEPRLSTRTERARWYRIAAHFRAGMRLRNLLASVEGAPVDAHATEAIMEPDGRVVHAEGSARASGARAALRRRAIEIDRARTRAQRSESDQALRIWRGLVDGTWSLVDHFDSDGRRFVVARRNEPVALDPRGLSEREFQVANLAATGAANKHIAYELGIGTTTVATLLQRAMRKLGARNRVELRRVVADAWIAAADDGRRGD